MKVWLFSYEEVISKGTNPRLIGYYEYLKEHGHSPCFCFLKGAREISSSYAYRPTAKVFNWPLLIIIKHLFTLLFHKPCDVAYFYGPNALFIPLYIVCRLRGIRVVIEKVELDSIKPVETWKDIVNWRLNQLDEWFAPRLADSLIVISARLQFHYRKWSQKTTLIGAFIPYHSLDKPVANNAQNQSFTIGYFGSFADKDDVKTLLKAFSYVQQQLPHANLKLIGNPTAKWSKKISQRNIISIKNVAHTDIHHNLLSCDVLIAIRKDNTYAHHGFPSKLAEYLATGIPVIATPSSDIPIIFKNQDVLTLVPHSDYQALGEAILQVSNNAEKYQAKARLAHQWAKDHWDPSTVLKKWASCVLAH